MVRSGKNIDESVIRGVSNIMAITNKKGAVLAPDVEIRFAEFGKDSTRRGIKTEVGGKTVILLNANATYKDTIRGTIAHEIVHYLENRKGYKALAEYAMKHAKAEKVAEVRETYEGVYEGENAEAKIEGEVVASVVAELLGNEKFLKRYAQMGEEQSSVVKRIARFVKGIASSLKEKDKKAGAVAAKMMELVDRALGSEVSGEKTGEKASFDISTDEAREWEKPITLRDVQTLRSIGEKSINKFTSQEIKIAQKWAHKFFKQLGVKSPFFRAWFGEWRQYDISPAEIVSFAYGENKPLNTKKRTVYSPELKQKVIVDENIIDDSYHYANINGDKKQIKKLLGKIDEILEKAILFDTQISSSSSGNKKGSTQFMHYLYTPVSVNGAPFIAKLTVEEYDLTSQTRAYNLQRIEMSDLSRAQFSQMIEENRGKYAYKSDALSVAQLYDFVKSKDETFIPAPKVSKYMLNEDGTPKVFYHGTEFDFNAFSYGKIGEASGVNMLGDGFYFADKKALAKKYGKTVKACYLSMHNPYIATQDDIYRLNADKLSKQRYDGVILKSPSGNIYMVFDNTQIKSADKAGTEKANIGTFDKSEPDIRYDLDPEAVEREAKRLTPKTDVKGQEVSDEFFEATVARSLQELNLSAEEKRQLAQERNKEAVEKRKAKFENLLGKAVCGSVIEKCMDFVVPNIFFTNKIEQMYQNGNVRTEKEFKIARGA